MSDIELTLTLDATTFLETASMPFSVTLRNAGSEPRELHDFTPSNQAVTLVAEATGGEEVLGTQISWKLRNGERFHEPRAFSIFRLAPGEEAVLRGDALAWLGVLAPGTYAFYATYSSGMAVYVETERVAVTITPAHPTAFDPVLTPARPAFQPIPVPWLHAVGEGGDDSARVLYLLDTSPYHPPNYYRNVPIATLPGPVEAVVSVPAEDTVHTRHVAWLDEGNRLRVVARTGDHGVSPPRSYSHGLGEATALLGPALTDAEGTLHLAATNDQGLFLLSVLADGRFQRRSLGTMPLDPATTVVLWGGDEALHLLARRPEGGVSYLQAERAQGPARAVALPDLGIVVRAMTLYQRYDLDEDAYRTCAVLLAEPDPDTARVVTLPPWSQWRLPLDTMQPEAPEAVDLPPGYQPFALALDAENDPQYLLIDREEALWLLHPDEGVPVPLLDARREPITAAAAPVLVPAAPFSRKGRLYVGYLLVESPGRTVLTFQRILE
ncbi:MAG: hypothetical protein D6685_19520 [Bacteroidetes bacterium]|nr:hypothetical protein AWN76_001495 [Rhodothermaceae bacterium RA]RMH49181.1 MAG: hypothetical protein D6685_19520 [Bacteroidota bacterium]